MKNVLMILTKFIGLAFCIFICIIFVLCKDYLILLPGSLCIIFICIDIYTDLVAMIVKSQMRRY